MLRLAGRVCDGVRLHGFCTRRYLEEVAIPNLLRGLGEQGRARASFEVCGGGFVATGKDDAAVARALEGMRYRIAFYGSTRTYLPVFELHGWQDLGAELHRLSREGRWAEMAACVPDDVVREFTAVARYDGLGRAIEHRFGGLSDSIEMGFPPSTPVGEIKEILSDLHRVPVRFAGQPLEHR
jgi:hypothetical protein